MIAPIKSLANLTNFIHIIIGYIMDTILKISSFSEESVHACIAACGQIDRIYHHKSDSSSRTLSLLKENAGLTQHAKPESRDALIAAGAYEWLQ